MMTLLLAGACAAGLKHLGALQRLELFAFDQLTQIQRPLPADDRLLIVSITEEDLQTYGWPLSDRHVAEIIATLQIHNPRVIGLDLFRNTPQSPGKTLLNHQLEAPNLIATMNEGDFSEGTHVPPPEGAPSKQVGFNDLLIDPDGVTRRALLYVGPLERPNFSLALRLVQAYHPDLALKATPKALFLGSRKLPILKAGDGGYHAIDNRGYQLLLRYRGPHSPARELTVSQVFSGDFDASWVRDKIVLIGSTAPSLNDEFYTPFSAKLDTRLTQSGVVVHAQIVSHLLDELMDQKQLYRFLPQWGELVWVLGWVGAAALLSWSIKRPLVLFLIGAGGLGAIALVGGWAFSQMIWLPLVEPAVGFLMAGALVNAQKVLYRSSYDELTQLPGRDLFLVKVQAALRRKRSQLAVLFLDLDRFRLINQSFGHSIGDCVLENLAQRLQNSSPSNTLVARVGADQFALLIRRSAASMESTIAKIQAAISDPMSIEQHRISVTATVGMAVASGGGSQVSPETLLRDAHTAMDRAKGLPDYRFKIFAEDMREAALQRLRLESNLLMALDNQEFLLHYQPIVCLRTGRLKGFEALVRWQPPDHSLVLPQEFIPVVEETGLILPLGQWIFHQACRQLKQWQQQFPQQELSMSINLSRRQFTQIDLAHQIETILSQEAIDGQRVQLEITESLAMWDVEAAKHLMSKLKGLGLNFSIDDFGTGYSSLSDLPKFPTDTLKIDRSFVGRMDTSQEDREIVQTIIILGRKLGMVLVAEGVETASQAVFLRQLNCPLGQGYFFSKPLTEAEATQLVEKNPVWPLFTGSASQTNGIA